MITGLPDIVRDLPGLRARVAAWRRAGESVAVVPTMGALHEGHLSLVRRAAADADRVIVTIFVNPRQFNSQADLDAYPRTEEADRLKLAGQGADIVYVPDGATVYPPGFATTVEVAGLSEGLCGAYRPGHFAGMATVVTKLFTQTTADLAYFGQKDFQQLCIVTRLAADLDLQIKVIGCPTLRETDGLAMSSRNTRLSAEARAVASSLYAELQRVAGRLAGGAAMSACLEDAKAAIVAGGYQAVEYLELRAEADLAVLDRPDVPARLLVAAWLDGVRLIDNIAIAAAA
ncbi:MAG: pantoate--beta-alanine ligase [Acetobacteraceae bacterium]|nr:pantoate--beta-alanine ligase [Acetobacteraceae bacterium]